MKNIENGELSWKKNSKRNSSRKRKIGIKNA